MSALFIKSWRDLWARRWQTLGLVLLVGLVVATTAGAERARRMLVETRETYYRELDFAHLDIRCSPTIAGVLERVADVPGIEAAEEIVLLPGVLHTKDTHPITATVRVLPTEGTRVDRLEVLEGRMPEPGEEAVLLDRSMKQVFGVGVGDTVEVEMRGVRKALPVVGLSISADHMLFPSNPEYFIPVPGTVAAVALSPAAAKAFPDTDFVTSIRFRFEEGADAEALEQRLLEDLGVSPIAVLADRDRPDYRSTQMILRFFDVYLPAAMLVLVCVALTLLVLTLRRLVQSQQVQIGVLVAGGHRARSIAATYVLVPAVAAILGSAIGAAMHAAYGEFIFQSYVNGVGFAPLRDPGTGPEIWITSVGSLLFASAIAFGFAYATARRRPRRLMNPAPPRGHPFPRLAHALSNLRQTLHLPLSVVLGLTYLSRQRWASVATVACLAANLALVVAFLYVHVTHVTETSRNLDRLGRDATVHLVDPIADEDLPAIAERVGGEVEPMILRNALFEFPGRRRLERTFCLSPDGWVRKMTIARGRALEDPAADEVLVDQWVSDLYGVDVGDEITCYPWYSAPEGETFEVVGVMGGPSHGMVIIPLEAGRALFGLPGLATTLSVGSALPAAELEARLRALPGVESVQSLSRVRDRVGETFGGLRRVLILAIVAAVLLAALFLALLAALDAAERAPDLALLRAVGWRERSMLTLCVSEVVTRGWLAYLLSVPLAPFVALWLLERLRVANHYRLELQAPGWICLAIGAACAVLMPLGALPAWRAARGITGGRVVRLLASE